jgi:hypothetical protein
VLHSLIISFVGAALERFADILLPAADVCGNAVKYLRLLI